MKTVKLEVKKRDKKTQKPRALRREGFIPATVYGPDTDPQDLIICQKDFRQIPFSDYTHIIELSPEGAEPFNTLIKDIQKQPVSGEVQNIEFYKLKKGHKVNIRVTLKFINNSEAVKMGAELLTAYQEVHLKCLPKSIPDHVEVDLSLLKEAEDTVTFADLKLGEDIELLDPPAEIICKAETKKKSYEEATPVAAEGDAAEGAADGAAPADGAAEAKAEDKKD